MYENKSLIFGRNFYGANIDRVYRKHWSASSPLVSLHSFYTQRARRCLVVAIVFPEQTTLFAIHKQDRMLTQRVIWVDDRLNTLIVVIQRCRGSTLSWCNADDNWDGSSCEICVYPTACWHRLHYALFGTNLLPSKSDIINPAEKHTGDVTGKFQFKC